MRPTEEIAGPPGQFAQFRTTHWSVVLRAGAASDSDERQCALEELCRTYWYPLYSFVRRRGSDPHEAQDLTQSFFARLLEKNSLALAEKERGRFRTFLLTAFSNFLVNEWERARRQKRGGGCQTISFDAASAEERYTLEPASAMTPEKAFEQRWIETLLEKTLSRLRDESAAEGQGDRFEQLKTFLSEDRGAVSFAEMASRLNTTEAAVKGVVRRLRARYRELLREEVAQTVSSPDEVEAEIRYLMTAFDS
jgi:RNA polymerase sigma-70 factor (ECF subfamily)